MEDLTVEAPIQLTAPILKENKWVLFLINFSALGFLMYPFLGIILPMILWVIFKDEITLANKTGKKVMKSQAIWCGLLFAVYLYIIIFKIFNLNLLVLKDEKVIKLSLISLYIFTVLDILINTLKIIEIKKAIFKIMITFKHRFIKGNITTTFLISIIPYSLFLC